MIRNIGILEYWNTGLMGIIQSTLPSFLKEGYPTTGRVGWL